MGSPVRTERHAESDDLRWGGGLAWSRRYGRSVTLKAMTYDREAGLSWGEKETGGERRDG